jgi:hypothetical protein
MLTPDFHDLLRFYGECVPLCLFATGLKKEKTEGKKCHAKTMKSKKS